MIQELYFVPNSISKSLNQMNTSVTLRYDTKTEQLQLVDSFGKVKTISVDTVPQIQTEEIAAIVDQDFIKGLGFSTTEETAATLPVIQTGFGLGVQQEGVTNTVYLKKDGVWDSLTGATGINMEDGNISIDIEFLDGFLANKGYQTVSGDQVCHADEISLLMSGDRTLSINPDWIKTFIKDDLNEKIAAGSGIAIEYDNQQGKNVISLTAAIPTGLGFWSAEVNKQYIINRGFAQLSDIPTAISYFANDSEYAPSAYVDRKVDEGKVTISSYTEETYLKKADAPTDLSSFTNSPGYLTEHQALDEYAQISTIPTGLGWWDESVNKQYIFDRGFALTSQLPTKVSQLLNDEGYLTKDFYLKEATYVMAYPSAAVSGGYLVIDNGLTLDQVSIIKNNLGIVDTSVVTGNDLATKYPNKFDRFLKLVFANKDINENETITNMVFVNVSELFKGYTAGEGIAIEDNKVSLTADIPSKVSDLTNDTGFITSANIPTSNSAFTNDEGFITAADIPTGVTAFANDAGYLTSEDFLDEVEYIPAFYFGNEQEGRWIDVTENMKSTDVTIAKSYISVVDDDVQTGAQLIAKYGTKFDRYLKLTFGTNTASSSDTKNIVYINVNELFSGYTAGKGIGIANNIISITGAISDLTNDSEFATSAQVSAIVEGYDYATNTTVAGVDGKVEAIKADYLKAADIANMATTDFVTGKVTALADGQVATNTADIAAIAADYTTSGFVNSKVAELANGAVATNTTDIAEISGKVDGVIADYTTSAKVSAIVESYGYITGIEGNALLSDIPTDLSSFTNNAGYLKNDFFLKDATYVKAFKWDAADGGYVVVDENMTADEVTAAKGSLNISDEEVTTGAKLVEKYGSLFPRFLKLVFATKDIAGNVTVQQPTLFVSVDELYRGYKAGDGIAIDDDTNIVSLTADIPTGLASWASGVNSDYIASLGFRLSDNDTQYGVVSAGGLTVTNDHNFAIDTNWVDAKLAPYALTTDIPTGLNDWNVDDTKNYISEQGFAQLSDIPTSNIGLANEAGYITGIEDNALLSDIKTKTSELDNDAEFITSTALPTKVSELENDAGYLTGYNDQFLSAAAYVMAFEHYDVPGSFTEVTENMTAAEINMAKAFVGALDDSTVTTGSDLIAKYGSKFDRCLKLVFATKNEAGTENIQDPIYIKVTELFSGFKAGNGIDITDNVISLDASISDLTNDSEFATSAQVSSIVEGYDYATNTTVAGVSDRVTAIEGDYTTSGFVTEKVTELATGAVAANAASIEAVAGDVATVSSKVEAIEADYATSGYVDYQVGNLAAGQVATNAENIAGISSVVSDIAADYLKAEDIAEMATTGDVTTAVDTAVTDITTGTINPLADRVQAIEDDYVVSADLVATSAYIDTVSSALNDAITVNAADIATLSSDKADKSELPTRVGELVNDKSYATISDIEAVRLSLLKQIANITSITSIDSDVNAPTQNLYINLDNKLTDTRTIVGKNITVTKLTNENSQVTFNATGDVVLTDLSGANGIANTDVQVQVNTPGRVTLTDSTFSENGNIAVKIGADTSINPPSAILIDNVKFLGTYSDCGVYIGGTANNTTITFNKCEFENVYEAIQLSNRTNASGVVINFIDCQFTAWINSMIFCHDENTVDNNLFASNKIRINIINCTNNGNLITFDDPKDVCATSSGSSQVLYIYSRGNGGTIAYEGNEDRFPTISAN